MSEKSYRIFKSLIPGLTGVFASYLLILSLFSTTVVFSQGEYYIKDTPLFSIIGILAVLCLFTAFKRVKTSTERHLTSMPPGISPDEGTCPDDGARPALSNIFPAIKVMLPALKIILPALLSLFMMWYLLTVRLSPLGDQQIIVNAASSLKRYDFSLFGPDDYYGYWPFQSRITVFIRLFFDIFGESNHIGLQILNAVSVTIALVLLSSMKTGRFSPGRFAACALFLPYLMYCTYIYGNLPGFACMMGCAMFLMRYLKGHRLMDGFLCGLCCGVSLWLKNSYQVIMIAVIIMIIMDMIRTKGDHFKEGVLTVAFIVALTGIIGSLSDAVLEKYLGFSLGEGSPMVSWVTMAFGEEEDGDPVRYDAYNVNVYLDNDLDTEKAEAAAIKELKERLTYITDTPGHFLTFMSRKVSRCWNDPTFESLAVNGKGTRGDLWPEYLKDALAEKEDNPLLIYDNIFHGVVLAGILMYIFTKRKDTDNSLMFFSLCFVGGFAFLLFWETLSQYAMVYFLMMIPVAYEGYDETAARLSRYLDEGFGERKPAGSVIASAVAITILLAICGLSRGLPGGILHPDHDDTAFYEAMYQQRLRREEIMAALPDGRYVITPLSASYTGIASGGDRTKDQEANRALPIHLAPIGPENSGVINIIHEHNYDLLRIERTQLLLSAAARPEDGSDSISLIQDGDEVAFRIYAVSPDEGQDQYYITMFDAAYGLCSRNGEPSIEHIEENNADFIWIINGDD